MLKIFLAIGLLAFLSHAAIAGQAYSNNGLAYRTSPGGSDLKSGEVYFATPPTTAQLQAAFPSYNAAAAAQQAQETYTTAIASGLTIASTSTPALDGTYAIDPATQANITAEQVYIATKGTFTNGASTKPWVDKSGALHVFPSTAEFTAFAVAVAQYIDALDTALATARAGGTPSWPSSTVALQ